MLNGTARTFLMPLLHTPNILTASSTSLSAKELQAIAWSEAYWTHNSEWTPLSPDHPQYDKACFHCHHLGHVRIYCQFDICPSYLCNTPDHIQNWCPLHHHLNPNQSNSSTGSVHLIPPFLADQLSSPPSHCTLRGSYCDRELPLHTSMPPMSYFVEFTLPLQVLEMMMSIVLRPGVTSMVTREFHWCFNITMGYCYNSLFSLLLSICSSFVAYLVGCLSPINCFSFHDSTLILVIPEQSVLF